MVNVKYQLFEVGHCKHCERITKKTGRLRAANFPAIVALISHPTKGKILFDTGYLYILVSTSGSGGSTTYNWKKAALSGITIASKLAREASILSLPSSIVESNCASIFLIDD
mgnify:CR=1 FL=1